MKLSTRDVQMFVGGGLMLMGFDMWNQVPHHLYAIQETLFVPTERARFVNSIFAVVAIGIGIAMIFCGKRSISCARIYLLVYLLIVLWASGIAVATVMFHVFNYPRPVELVLHRLPPPFVLLGLLEWSLSKKFLRIVGHTPIPHGGLPGSAA